MQHCLQPPPAAPGNYPLVLCCCCCRCCCRRRCRRRGVWRWTTSSCHPHAYPSSRRHRDNQLSHHEPAWNCVRHQATETQRQKVRQVCCMSSTFTRMRVALRVCVCAGLSCDNIAWICRVFKQRSRVSKCNVNRPIVNPFCVAHSAVTANTVGDQNWTHRDSVYGAAYNCMDIAN